MLTCINDRYDPHGSNYDDVHDFIAMCLAAYGERVHLEDRDGEWFDQNNEVVLVPADSDGNDSESAQ